VLRKAEAKQPIADTDWQRVFTSEPYVALKRREASMGRAFQDEAFKQYVLSAETVANTSALAAALERWKTVDLRAAAAQALDFLPKGASIHALIYPLIKPRPNSFVFEGDKIMLYLDAAVSEPAFRNTVTHELHHIGIDTADPTWDGTLKAMPANARMAARNMGRFAEGFAMLAAAGSVDVHPHATSDAKDRERWDRDSANFANDVVTLDAFFRDILDGKFPDDQAVQAKAMEFYGIQGPWYTVGYRMAAAVEKRYGRPALLECMTDPRKLLATWNVIAAEQKAVPRWSATLLTAVQAAPVTSFAHSSGSRVEARGRWTT
jgi:hypothetical protein